MAVALEKAGIVLNYNTVPGETRKAFDPSGIRLGTPSVTSRGLGTDDMKTLAELIYLTAADFDAKADYIRSEVTKICEKYPLYKD